jgi:isocitrate dehydrogenase
MKKIKVIFRAIKELIVAAIQNKPQALAHIILKDNSKEANLSVYSLEMSQGEALRGINTITSQALQRLSTDYQQQHDKSALTAEGKK